MATPSGNSVPLTGDPFVDGLTDGSSWQLGGARLITFSLSLNDGPSGGAWTFNLANAARAAFSVWSNVANVSFQEVGSGTVFTSSSADIAATLTGSDLHRIIGSTIGVGIYPDPAAGNGFYAALPIYTRASYPRPEGDVFFDNYSAEYQYLQAGGYGFMAMVHEIGHALGLKHPFDTNANDGATFASLGIDAYDNRSYTVMSYTQASSLATVAQGNPSTPMPLDIAAIQYIYGANMSFHTGNDIYALTNNGVVSTIWDAGGTDTLDASPLGFGTTVNLNPGSIMNTGAKGSITAIAYNVTIENAIGSSGNDTIYGNNVANVINGGAGNDTMAGGNGNDTYYVDSILDVVIENPGAGTDLIISNSTTYSLPNNVENITIGTSGITVIGNELANTMIGNAIGNTLNGQSGDDFIDGGPGGDVMAGGPGNDTFVVDNGADVVSEITNDGIDTALSSISYVLPANVENLTLTGNLNLSGTGNSLDNILTSNSGIDTLTGGLGNDTYFLNNPSDVVIENPNAGIDTVVAGFGYSLVGTNLENVTLIGGANLTVMGNGFNNFLTSNSGVNTLTGGLGNDIYVLNNAADTVVENPGEGIDAVISSFSYSLGVGSNLENVTLFGTDSINATGDGLNNQITGNNAPNILIGGLGNDTLTGGNALDTARFSGLMSSYTITHTGASGTVTGPDGTDTFSSVERLQFDDQSLLFVAPKNDFNGDNQSDVMWHNTIGQLALWQMSGSTLVSAGAVAGGTIVSADWHVAALQDFDGDGKTDILWRNNSGAMAEWNMNGMVLASGGAVAGGAVVLTDWQIAGVGDFGGDGKSDILWQHTSGQLSMWQMDGSTLASAGAVVSIPTDWRIAGVADFNGDGKGDILWRHSSGVVAEWNMDGTAIASGGLVAGGGAVTADWQIAGVGDFGGDGKNDILWQNTNGQLAIWQMNGSTLLSAGAAAGGATVSADWHIGSVADFNGDGKSDILWRNNSGAVAEWNMNGTAIASAGAVAGGTAVSADWIVT